MPVMNIRHVIVVMFFSGMFMLMRVDSLWVIVPMRWVIVAVTMFMDRRSVRVCMRMFFVDE